MKNIFFSVSMCLSTVLFCHGAKNIACETSSNFIANSNVNLFVKSACLADPGEVIYYDDFTTNKGLKTDGFPSNGTYHYGYFELSVADSKRTMGILQLNKIIDQKKDFQIEATIKLMDVTDFTNGIIWGKMNSGWDNCFSFGFDKEGRYSIGGRKNNEWSQWIKSLTPSVYIKPLEYNKLSIRKIGDTYYFYINDKQVHTCPFEDFYGNQNYLYTSDNSTIRISKINISYLAPPSNHSSGNDNGSARENTIDPINTSISNPISPSMSEYIYNEIPAGVQLVRSEAEWLKISPEKACCCYSEFNEENKSHGLLYNFKAYEKIVVLLNANNSGMKVCTKEQWNEIISKCNSDVNNINTLQLNSYPGYYDEVWYSIKELFSGYWLDEHALISFSNENYGEPMIDDNVINDESEDSYRHSLAAFSIRLSKSENNLCGEQKWLNEPILVSGEPTSIKFISNAADWNKQAESEACCCFINYDFNNDKYGFLYNKKGYDECKRIMSVKGYRVATAKDWNDLITCSKNNGTIGNLYNCDEDSYNDFNLEPNGYYKIGTWHLPEEKKSWFWVESDKGLNVYEFNCESKGEVKQLTAENKSAFMIRFIKK